MNGEKNILIEAHRAIYVILKKNGCTSMKSNLVSAVGLNPMPDFPKDIHSHKKYPFLSVEPAKLNSDYRDYTKFAISRNPWSRLVSCYLDKIKNSDDPAFNGQYHKNGVSTSFLNYGDLFFGGMSFDAFVDAICQIQDSESDAHFQSQLYNITDSSGELLVNYIGRLERINDALAELSDKTGMPLNDLPRLHKMSSKKHYTEFYTEELIEKFRNRFAADIDFFDYEFKTNPEKAPIGFVTDELKERLLNASYLAEIIKEKKNASRNALSWKITNPLRKIASIFRK